MYTRKSDIKNWETVGICGIDCYQARVEIKAVEYLSGDTYVFAVTNPDKKPHKVKVTMCDRPYFRVNGFRYFMDEVIKM